MEKKTIYLWDIFSNLHLQHTDWWGTFVKTQTSYVFWSKNQALQKLFLSLVVLTSHCIPNSSSLRRDVFFYFLSWIKHFYELQLTAAPVVQTEIKGLSEKVERKIKRFLPTGI